MAEPRVALITFPGKGAAAEFARHVVEARLVACVNIVPGVTSVYAWEGKVETADEVLAIVKTTDERVAQLQAALGDRHPYDTPEFVVLEPDHVEPKYLDWLRQSTAFDE